MPDAPAGWLHAPIQLLAPSRCLACRRRGPVPWCRACAATVVRRRAGCPRCAGATAAHRCWPDHAPVAATLAAFDYRGALARAVVTAKVTGAHAGWRPLGALLAEDVAAAGPDVDVITWVTTPPGRRRRRGLDHAEVLARAVGERVGVPVARLLAARPAACAGDHYVAVRALPGSEVLLVDDVLTTGRTAARAARALRSAGAGNVRLAVLARAGTHDLLARPSSVTAGARRGGRDQIGGRSGPEDGPS